MLSKRPPAVADRFYPADERECRHLAEEYFCGVTSPPGLGGIVPHAGWMFSGSTAALAIAGVAAAKPETIVIFGAVHGPDPNPASVFARGEWDTPLGPLAIDEDLAARFVRCGPIADDLLSHRREHAIEVQLPLVKHVLPEVRIVPISVRPGAEAAEIGRLCAREAVAAGRRIGFLGSSDLTHYGPAFGFEPHGHGQAGIRWAKDVNDRRLIALIQGMNSAAIVPEAALNRNACGAGAIAATIAAMVELGAVRYEELRHTCSAEFGDVGDRDLYNSVGYEAGVFLAPGA
jgi:hypothetical protein